MKRFALNKNWKFKIAGSSNKFRKFGKWMDCKVPGTVHTDLLNLGLIEDPFYEDNELSLQWIGERDWFYKTIFDLPKIFKVDNTINLVFEGVDTIAEAWLNKKPVGKFQNMFRKYEFDVSKILKEQNNLLEIKFCSSIKFAKEQEKIYGKLSVALNSERVYIRKAQYSFGWDWGPSFPTSGLWKPVYLEQNNDIRIKNVSVDTIELKKDKAVVEVSVLLSGNITKSMGIDVSLKNDNHSLIINKTNLKQKNNFRLEIKNPNLWWPNGYGDQPLYNLAVELTSAKNKILDRVKKYVGIRTVELKLNENNQPTFKFVINNKEIFIRGVNWIPADSFLPRVSNKNCEQSILAVREANCNMIRIWGGGVYERDYFYNLCDEHGILVWQDFMFACSAYPEHISFLDNIKDEVSEQVERLQHHASLALWCGNNENEWIWYQTQKHPLSLMPGYKIYNKTIPGILAKVDPGRPYWPSSPFGNNKDPNDQQSGNTHQWNIWSNWTDYNEVKKDSSLFVSEFGFQAPANMSTWEGALSKDKFYCQNQIFESHNKQTEGPERLFKFLSGHLPVSNEWSEFIYLTQLNQALALKTCIEHWRTNKITNGCLIWQLNDCWPVVSWSIIDSSQFPKMSYYFVKNVFAPLLILFKRDKSNLKVYVLNQGLDSVMGYLKLAIIKLSSGEVLYNNYKEVLLKGNSYKPAINIPEKFQKNSDDNIFIVTFYNQRNELITRNFHLDREWKHIKAAIPKINIKRMSSKKKNALMLSTNKPAYFVDLYHPKISFSDRGFFLLPGEEKTLKISLNYIREINIKDIEIFVLNNFLSG